MLRRLLPLPLAALAALALASAVLAGGWAQVTVLPTDPPAGEETTIELNVLQHGVTAVSWPQITVIATNDATDEVVVAQAKASGPEGHYTAKLTFPSEGAWTISFVSPELVMEGTATLSVGPAIVPAVVAAPKAAAPSASIDLLPLALVLIVALFAAIAIAAVTMRSREARAAGAGRVTART